MLADLAGPRPALRFLLDRAAAEPRWFTRLGSDVWSQGHWQLAEWRAKGEPLGALEAPLLAYVLARLARRHLARGHAHEDRLFLRLAGLVRALDYSHSMVPGGLWVTS